MKNFSKVVNPCTCKVYGRKTGVNAFCRINYIDGCLSITGVVGPKNNGDCCGSAGQCEDEIRKGTPTLSWNTEMLKKFCDIWNEYHLNDMRPYCTHQKELGWDKKALEKVTFYNYVLKSDIITKQNSIKRIINEGFKNSLTVSITEDEQRILNLPYFFSSYIDICPNEYKLDREDSYKGSTEIKALGWVTEKEHPEGILSKPCPVCGYKYGNGWKKEEIPENVLQWLYDLPKTTNKYAWV